MAQIVGTSGNDTLAGASGGDTITGSAGNDSLTGATGTGQNLLIDGSFETANVGPHTWTHFANVGGWYSDTGIEVWGKDFIHSASNGDKLMELDYDNQFSKVWQDVKTVAGQEYTLSLDTAMRPGTASATNAINILWDGQVVGRIVPGTTDWQTTQIKVIGSGGTDRLQFQEDANQNDSYGGLIDNVKLTSDAHGNVLVGGTGNDTLVAGNSGDLLVGNDAKSGDVDLTKMKIAQDVTAHVTFDGSGAGYHNAVGMYTYDNSGNVTGVKMIYGNVSGQGVGSGIANTDIAMKAGDHFGFFVASNAYYQNGNSELADGSALGGSFKLVDATNGGAANVGAGHEMKLVFVAADGTQTDVKTQYGTSLFTTNTADNVDGFQHSHVSVDPLTGKLSVAFEDLLNGGDKNFHDANFSINIGATNAVQLAHTGVSGHSTAQNNDMLTGGTGNDTLIGMAGDDTLNGGLGNNNLYGGSGNDHFIAGGGNDLVVGGSGFDTIDFSNATAGVNVDLSKHTATGFGTDTIKGVEAVIGSAFNDVMKGDKGNNSLSGGDGNDVLRGYTGNDTLTGGAGNDTFQWLKSDLAGGGKDEVVDFGNGKDVLDLHNLFNGVKGSHAGLVTFVDGKTSTELWATVGGHQVDVATLDGVHHLTVTDLLHTSQILL